MVFVVGCPTKASDDPDSGNGSDAATPDATTPDVVPADGGMDAAGPGDVPPTADTPAVDTAPIADAGDVPADLGPPPVACESAVVVDLNARVSPDGGVSRYVGSTSSAPRAPSLQATCVGADGMGEALYQVVHRYVPRVTGRLRLSVDDAATDVNFDTVLFAQGDCRVLRSEEQPLGCNDDVRASTAARQYASALLSARVVAGVPAYIVVAGAPRGPTGSLISYGAYALTVSELPEVALGAPCDLAVVTNVCAPSSSCLGASAAAARCVMDGLDGTRCRTSGGTDCDAGLRCVDAFCRRALPLNAPCGVGIDGVCPEAASCQWVDGANRCVATGTRGADCRDDGARCDAGLACVHTRSGDHCQTAAPAGGACDPWGFRSACPGGAVCGLSALGASGLCVAPGSVAGARCLPEGGARCATGLQCRLGPDGENELCVRTVAPAGACDPLGGTTLCTMDTDCAPNAALTDGVCVAPGTAAGAPCRVTSPRCDTGTECSTTTGAGQCQRVLAAGAACDPRYGSTRCTGGLCVTEGAATTCRTATAETEPNDAPASGTAVTGNAAVISGALAGTDIRDCVRVTVPAGASLVAETYTGDDRVCVRAGGDPSLTVFGPSGVEVVSEDDSPGRGLCTTIAPRTHAQASGLAAGVYSLCVGRGAEAVPSYRLAVMVFP